ncbi:hypothetical protein HY408_01230 [Candidatus Gottesmanbacteria bacterium]|nr:hypothetical protein [Candidatus Gottesmanbacteria bacterium]
MRTDVYRPGRFSQEDKARLTSDNPPLLKVWDARSSPQIAREGTVFLQQARDYAGRLIQALFADRSSVTIYPEGTMLTPRDLEPGLHMVPDGDSFRAVIRSPSGYINFTDHPVNLAVLAEEYAFFLFRRLVLYSNFDSRNPIHDAVLSVLISRYSGDQGHKDQRKQLLREGKYSQMRPFDPVDILQEIYRMSDDSTREYVNTLLNGQAIQTMPIPFPDFVFQYLYAFGPPEDGAYVPPPIHVLGWDEGADTFTVFALTPWQTQMFDSGTSGAPVNELYYIPPGLDHLMITDESTGALHSISLQPDPGRMKILTFSDDVHAKGSGRRVNKEHLSGLLVSVD